MKKRTRDSLEEEKEDYKKSSLKCTRSVLVDGKNRDVLQFYSKTNGPLLLLSNFCRLPISFAHSDLPKPVVSLFSTSFPLKNKLSFITGEHAFHSFKFLSIAAASKGKDEESDEGGRKRALILRALKFEGDKPFFKTAAEAKSGGGKGKKNGFSLTPRELKAWDENDALFYQRLICKKKKDSHLSVAKVLEESKLYYLLHFENNRLDKNTCSKYGGKIINVIVEKREGEGVECEDGGEMMVLDKKIVESDCKSKGKGRKEGIEREEGKEEVELCKEVEGDGERAEVKQEVKRSENSVNNNDNIKGKGSITGVKAEKYLNERVIQGFNELGKLWMEIRDKE